MVLLIDGPLRPQVVDEDQPVAGQREEIEDGRWKMGHVTLTRDYGTTGLRDYCKKQKLGK
jgi:hypothetical protein